VRDYVDRLGFVDYTFGFVIYHLGGARARAWHLGFVN